MGRSLRHTLSAAGAMLLLSLVVTPVFAGDVETLPLVPMPAVVETSEGRFVVQPTARLHAGGDVAVASATRFADLVERTLGLPLRVVEHGDDATAPAIRFRIEAPSFGPAEGYRLQVDADGIDVIGNDAAGLHYGSVTLWQLLTAAPREGNDIVLQAIRIVDAPRFGWRGYMLDSARHFHTVDEVKQILDAMSLHKLNVFHWHLTDDQGWRVEIREYPKLTEVGGCRQPIGDAATDDEGKPAPPYCGWYTQAQIRDIVAYAAERHITVVPEIDVPGHATAAIAAYPQLGVSGRPMPVSNQRGIHANLFNVDEATFAFLDDVFAEIVDLFPSRYIHIGADEAVKTQWKASSRVQARMRELGIGDEDALQSWFVQRLETMLARHDRRLIGWDEILEGGLAPNATVMSWRGTEGGIEAAKLGHDVVMSPVSSMYLDYLQTASPNEPAGRPRLNTMETFYGFEPVPVELDATQRRHILGLQANMWTGDTRTFAGVLHNTFPRLAAVAETGWTPARRKDYASFLQRLPAQLQRYRLTGLDYAHTPFEAMLASVAPVGDVASATHARITLSNPLDYRVHYTLDGSEPDAASPTYQEPLHLALPVTLRAAAFLGDEALAPAQMFTIDRPALLARDNAQLSMCSSDGPVLRMEDDGPVDGPRALFNVAVFAPCWRWPDAPMTGIARLQVRAGQLPYLFQLSESEERGRKFLPAESAHGELDVRADGCDGPRIASVPLPAGPDADGFVTVEAPVITPATGTRDLCIRFSGDMRPAMWVLDRIELVPTP